MGKNETKNYVGGSGMDDMELDERDIQLMEESRKEGKKKLFIALGAIVLAVIVVVIYIVVRKNMTGKSESEDLIKTYMEGLEEADLDKVESVMDPDTIDSDSSKDLVTVFQTYKENNIEIIIKITPFKHQILTKAFFINSFQELFGNELVRIDVIIHQRY